MESDKFKLGLFLILSFIICCFLFVVFGLFDYGQEKVQIVTLFDESVQGLEVGSTVQLRGVPVGKVKDITISMQDQLIRIDMEIDLKKVRMQAIGGQVETEISEPNFYNLIRQEISKGLCAQLQMNGITGGKSIGLDYADKNAVLKEHVTPGFNNDGVFYMPSRPSAMMDLRKKLYQTLENIAAVDFRGISERTEKLLTSVDTIITNPALEAAILNIEKLTKELNKSVGTFNQALPPERIIALINEAQQTMANAKQAIAMLNKEIENAKIGETTEAIRNASNTVTDNRRLIKDSLVRMRTALDRLSELLQTIEENPEVFIHGKINKQNKK